MKSRILSRHEPQQRGLDPKRNPKPQESLLLTGGQPVFQEATATLQVQGLGIRTPAFRPERRKPTPFHWRRRLRGGRRPQEFSRQQLTAVWLSAPPRLRKLHKVLSAIKYELSDLLRRVFRTNALGLWGFCCSLPNVDFIPNVSLLLLLRLLTLT